MEALSFYTTSFLLILFCTAFVKIITTLSIFRYGLGLKSFPFGIVIFGLSIVLTLFVSEPYLQKAGGVNFISSNSINVEKLDTTFRPFMEKHVDPKIIDRLQNIKSPDSENVEFTTLLTGFMLSELQIAFIAGFAVLIPFLIIDLLVVNILTALNVAQISSSVVALPFKLLLFFVVDGWLLITEKLIGPYFIV